MPRAKRVLNSNRSKPRVLLVARGTDPPERRLALVPLVTIGKARKRSLETRLAPKSADGKSKGPFWATLPDDSFGTTKYLVGPKKSSGPMLTNVEARVLHGLSAHQST